MNIEKRIFDFALWLIAVCVLLALLTSCSPYAESYAEPTATARGSPTITRTPTPHPTCTVTTGIPFGSLNIRTGAGVSYAVMGLLHEGDTLQVITRGAWLKVKTIQHKIGWINSKYCK